MFDIKTLGKLIADASSRIKELEDENTRLHLLTEVTEDEKKSIQRTLDQRSRDLTRVENELYMQRNTTSDAVRGLNNAKKAFKDELQREGVYLPGAILGTRSPQLMGTETDINKLRSQITRLAAAEICPEKIKMIAIIRDGRQCSLKDAKALVDAAWPPELDVNGSFLPEPKSEMAREFVSPATSA